MFSGALTLDESFIELKYFDDVATPALLCYKDRARSKHGRRERESWRHDLGPDLGSRVLHSARFIYVRYADGLVQQGVRMFNFLVIVIIASLYGYCGHL